jgi:uncharacterized protein (DUF302 family)
MDYLLTTSSKLSVRETMDRLEAAARAKGLMIFARINHAAGASKAGIFLRPSELLVFGDPHVGTPLMRAEPRIGIDLPLRALVWQDNAEQTWIATVNPKYLAERRGISGAEADQVVHKMTEALTALVQSTASRH